MNIMANNNVPRILENKGELIFLYKPPHWDCYMSPGQSAVQFAETTKRNKMLLKWIYENLEIDDTLLKCKVCRLGLLNRLDKETSGIVLVANNVNNFIKYRKMINDHDKSVKIYLALVNGILPHYRGTIEQPLIHDDRRNRTYIKNNYNGNDAEEVQKYYAHSEYLCVSLYNCKFEGETKYYSLVLVRIRTGKTHQIRVHMKSIGNVIFCDKYYNNDHKHLSNESGISDRLFLHSLYYKLGEYDAFCDIPKDLSQVLNKMELLKSLTTIQKGIKKLTF